MKFERLTELLDEIASAADGGIEAMRNATLSEGFRLLAFLQDEQKNGCAPILSGGFLQTACFMSFFPPLQNAIRRWTAPLQSPST